MLKNQKYGVEIEFTGITRKEAALIVADVLGTTISRIESGTYNTHHILDSEGRRWKVMRDGSIEPTRSAARANAPFDQYRVEFVTPPLRYDDIELLQKIVRAFRAAGATANSSCGIHIHVDGANHNAMSLRRLVKLFVARQDFIYEGLDISSSRANYWCKPMAHTLIDEMAKKRTITRDEMEAIWYGPANDGYNRGINHEHYNSTRYHGLNLHSFFSKGTVEFRLFNSTLHAGKVKAYIQFCLAISAWAIITPNNGFFKTLNVTDRAERARIWEHSLKQRFDLVGEEFATCRYHLTAGYRTGEDATAAA